MASPFASHGGLHARFLSLRCKTRFVTGGESRGQALKLAESYTFSMTDAIHREFAKYANSRTVNPFACLLLSRPEQSVADRSQQPPIEAVKDNLKLDWSRMAAASSAGIKLDDVQERADHWKKLLWEATISADSEHVEDRHEVASFKNMLNALYDGVPPQSAASPALAETSYRHLRRLAEISGKGLKRLQPELRRGQQRILLIVSDSTIVFCEGSTRKRNFKSSSKGEFPEGMQEGRRAPHLQGSGVRSPLG